MSGEHIRHVSDIEEYRTLLSTGSCVVKFTAVWCGPCKVIAPAFKKLTHDYMGKITAIEVDIDADGADEISDLENVQAVPYVLFYRNGHIAAEHVGGSSKAFEQAFSKFMEGEASEVQTAIRELESPDLQTAIAELESAAASVTLTNAESDDSDSDLEDIIEEDDEVYDNTVMTIAAPVVDVAKSQQNDDDDTSSYEESLTDEDIEVLPGDEAGSEILETDMLDAEIAAHTITTIV